jgi:probable HAF family extracellular repeat protein
MRKRLRVAGLTLIGLAAPLIMPVGTAAAPNPSASVTYTYVEIPVLGDATGDDAYNATRAINNAGQVVGVSTSGSTGCPATIHAFMAGAGSAPTDLGTIPRRPCPWTSIATAINEDGDAVGYGSYDRYQPSHAVLFRGGLAHDLGTGLGSGAASSATGINDAGQIVGSRSVPGRVPERAAVWQNGTIRGLQDLGGVPFGPYGTVSRATAVNNAGDVVGFALAENRYYDHAVVWRAGRIQDLGAQLGGQVTTRAVDINDAGQILIARANGGTERAYSWQNGAIRDLGAFYPQAHNSAGQAVGSTVVTIDGIPHRHAVTTHDGGVVDLNRAVTDLPSDVTLGWANGVNDSGVIAAYSCVQQCRYDIPSAPHRAFLLIPDQ